MLRLPNSLKHALPLLTLAAGLAGRLDARIINVPEQFETIQAAIGDSRDGDTVLVQPGTYAGTVNFGGRAIVVGSLILTTGDRAYIDSTIIDGEEQRPCVVFNNGESRESVLRGFTVTRGRQNFGGGIDCQQEASPTLVELRVTQNIARRGGGGAHSSTNCRPLFMNCLFDSNKVEGGVAGGGGMSEYQAHPLVINCKFVGNTVRGQSAGGGAIQMDFGSITIDNCLIMGNSTEYGGGGINLNASDTLIVRNTIIQSNSSVSRGGALFIQPPEEGRSYVEFSHVAIIDNRSNQEIMIGFSTELVVNNLTFAGNRGQNYALYWIGGEFRLSNSIFWDNEPQRIHFTGMAEIDFSLVQNGRDGISLGRNAVYGDNNLDVDPRFVDPESGDYRLLPDSPCIDAGDPDSPPDPDGSRADIGALPFWQGGQVFGRVLRGIGEEPMAGARVMLIHNDIPYGEAESDSSGNWLIERMLLGENILETSKEGFVRSVLAFEAAALETVNVDLRLFQSWLELPFAEVVESVPSDSVRRLDFAIRNGGDTVLEWTSSRHLRGEAGVEPWTLRRSLPFGQVTRDDRIEGVVFARDRFYVAGASNLQGRDTTNFIWVLDREGNLVDTLEQPGESTYGMKNLAWDGNWLWGGQSTGDANVYAIHPETGEVMREWAGPYNPTTAVVWDEDEGRIWACGQSSAAIVAYDVDGNRLGPTLNKRPFRITGMAWWREDPNGYPLYFVHSAGANDDRIYKMNPATGDTLLVRPIQLQDASAALGTYITNTFDVYSWVYMAIANVARDNGGDRIDIYQLDARKDWLNLDVWSGVLEPWSVQEFVLTFNSTGLPDTLFEGEILFRHNAEGGETRIPVSLDVIGDEPPDPFDLLRPANGSRFTAFPYLDDTLRVPAIRFSWMPSMEWNQNQVVGYRVWFYAGNDSTYYEAVDTSLTLVLDTLNLDWALNAPVAWQVNAYSGDDRTVSNQRFQFAIDPDAAPGVVPVPVEFGFQSVHPNPFNARLAVRFGLDQMDFARLRLFDVLGREAAVLFAGPSEPAYRTAVVDGNRLSSGVYYLRLESAGRVEVRKVALVR
ncbi:MAG: hypothetical protein FJY67_05965 [Calditrichaeota bacterium]|nr:hypothetical protein [Calditrichota bacterium]